MASITPLNLEDRYFGENLPIAPDVNKIADKVDELVDAVNAGLATSNVIVGGDKYVRYLSSQTYGVPADALTLDRLSPETILPGTEATVINPADNPLATTAASKYYRATIVPAGTAGAVLVPAFVGSSDRLPIAWVEVVSNDTFTPLAANEVNPGKGNYAGLQLRPLLIALVNGIGTGSTTVISQPATIPAVTGPTVTGFLPPTAAEGASVTLTGTGFTKATAVLFNGTPASFQIVNVGTIVATVPVGATTGPLGVTNAAGIGTSAASFTVKATVVVTPGDTVKPDVSFTVPAAGATLAPNTQVLLSVIANDNVAVAGLTFTNGATGEVLGQGAKNGSVYTFLYTTGAAGPLSLVATATDAAGNSQSATVNVTVGSGTTTPTPTPDLTAALAISLATVMLGSPVAFTIAAGGGTLPYAYEVVATDNVTGQQFTLGTASSGSWTPTVAGSYTIGATVSDSSAPTKRAQAITRYLQVTQAVNRIPVADAGADVTVQLPTSSLALMGRATDPDTGDTIATHTWRQITGPNTAVGIPATTQNVLVTGLVAGTYQFGYRATDNHGAQSDEDFVLVTVLAGAAVVLVPTKTDYTQSQSDYSIDGVHLPSSQGTLPFQSDASSVVLEGVATNAGELGGDVSLFTANDVFLGTYLVGNGPVTVPLPGGSGMRGYYFCVGQELRKEELGEVQGCTISKLTFPAGAAAYFYKPTYTDAVVILGDSIDCRPGRGAASATALAPYLRKRRPGCAVTNLSYGSRQMGVAIGTDAQLQDTLARMLAAAGGVAAPTFYLPQGINDYGTGSMLVADLNARLKILIASLKNAKPLCKVYVQTLLRTSFEGQLNQYAGSPNKNTSTPQQWRAIQATIANDLPYVQVRDGVTMISAGGLSADGIHPSPAGNEDEYFPAVADTITSGAGLGADFYTTFGVIDPNDWINQCTGTGTVAGSSGGLIGTPGFGNPGLKHANRSWLSSRLGFAMANRRWAVELVQVMNAGDSAASVRIDLGTNTFESIASASMAVQDGFLYGQRGDGAPGHFKRIAYDPVAHRFLGIAIDAQASRFYCQYSADGVTWYTLYDEAIGSINAAAARLGIHGDQGDTSVLRGPFRVASASVGPMSGSAGSSSQIIEDTDAGWTLQGPWTNNAQGTESGGSSQYIPLGQNGTATRTLPACASIDAYISQPGQSVVYSADYFVDGVYKGTAYNIPTGGDFNGPAIKVLTIPGPFTAGQVLKVATPTSAHDPGVANHYTILDKIVYNF